jgi:hypothetical protein
MSRAAPQIIWWARKVSMNGDYEEILFTFFNAFRGHPIGTDRNYFGSMATGFPDGW